MDLYKDVLLRKNGTTRILLCSRWHNRYTVEAEYEFQDSEIGNKLLDNMLLILSNFPGIEDIDALNDAIDRK